MFGVCGERAWGTGRGLALQGAARMATAPALNCSLARSDHRSSIRLEICRGSGTALILACTRLHVGEEGATCLSRQWHACGMCHVGAHGVQELYACPPQGPCAVLNGVPAKGPRAPLSAAWPVVSSMLLMACSIMSCRPSSDRVHGLTCGHCCVVA